MFTFALKELCRPLTGDRGNYGPPLGHCTCKTCQS